MLRHSLLRLISVRSFPDTVIISWEANCAADDATNGVDYSLSGTMRSEARRLARAVVASKSASGTFPPQFVPTLPTVSGSEGVIKNFILEDNTTGVVRSFH